MHIKLEKGFKGFIQNWRFDFMAAISVALVALPLGLAVAAASGIAPISGVISAIIGGIITTFIRPGNISINGPTASIIGVVAASMLGFDNGDGKAFHYVMAALFVAGALQFLLGLFKLGRFAEIFPTAVINGILAAIGVFIIADQIHLALDTMDYLPKNLNAIEKFKYIFQVIPYINFPILIITLAGLLLLFFHAKISYKLFHFLPAPIWVLVLSFVLFYFFQAYGHSIFQKDYNLDAKHLINVPDDLSGIFNLIPYPDFSQMDTFLFWITAISVCLILSIENLAATKAIDRMDPFKRKTNLNKDLMAMGLSTMISTLCGGLPIINVIVRTTVNIHNNARTRWSNFFHGVLLLIFIALFAKFIQLIPLAALSAILIFMGFKLASPRLFKESYAQGMEQLLFLTLTVIIAIYSNLIVAILGGIAITLLVHLLMSRLPISVFFQFIFKSGSKLIKKSTTEYELRLKGIANFLSILHVKELLAQIPAGADVKVNLSATRILDLTMQEELNEFKKRQSETGGKVRLSGLDHHISSSKHKLALKSLISYLPQKLSPRQIRIKKLAQQNAWHYRQEVDWDISSLQDFEFFYNRPIEYKENVLNSQFSNQIEWELSDITFDEGALLAKEVYHTTVQIMHLKKEIPKFVLEYEGFFDKIFDRVLSIGNQKDVQLDAFPEFSSRFLLKAEDTEQIKLFFKEDLVQYLLSKDVYHIESNGKSILLFRNLRLARTEDISDMIQFSKALAEKIM